MSLPKLCPYITVKLKVSNEDLYVIVKSKVFKNRSKCY